MKEIKNKKIITEEQNEVKKFILVLCILVIVIVGFYYFTKAFVTKDLFKKETGEIEYTAGVINSDVAIVGNMLNRPYSEYYVIAFSKESMQLNYYNTLVSKYKSKEKALKVYLVDLNNSLNKKYVAEGENKSTSFKSLEELKFGEITLMRVKNGKVTKFITNIEDIKKEWSI